jgi:ligand-binding sensor domain-containing protein/signal transduction histidine kinase
LALLPGWPAAAGMAAPGEFLIRRWDSSDGLPDSTVRSMAQTPDGYLWIGTENGLARFDGVRFENFLRENTPALPNPNVEFLQLGKGGRLWIGAREHVSIWDGRRVTEQAWPFVSGDRLARLLISQTNEVYFSTAQGCLIHGQVAAGDWCWTSSTPGGPSMFAVGTNDEIWRLSLGGRLWRMVGQRAERVSVPPAMGQLNLLEADAHGGVWVTTAHQFWQVAEGGFQPVPPPPGETNAAVADMVPMEDGSLWLAVNGNLWKFKDGRWLSRGDAWPFHAPTFRKLLEDRAGNAWLSSFGGPLLRLGRDGQVTNIPGVDGLPVERIRCLFQDREGNLWAGIDRGGLVRLREKQFQVLDTAVGLSASVVLGVCVDGDGAVWASTYGGGLDRWANGRFTTFNFGTNGLPDYVFTAFPDREGRLWVGTRDHGVFLREDGVFRNLIPPGELPQPTRALFEDRAGTVWLGTGAGVYCWRQGRLESFAADTELGGADVRGFCEDTTGGLWICTHGNGLHRFLAGGHLALHAADGLPNEFVRSLFADQDGAVWVGMYGGGLWRWKAGRLARAAPARDLPDDVICHFEEDDTGHFWISTHHGLFRVAKAELNAFADGREKSVSCTVYGKYDGLPTVEFSGGIQPAGWHDRDGRLWFANDSGLISLRPGAVTVNRLPPPVAVESVLVDGELFASSLDKGPAVGDVRQKLVIPAGRTQVEFQFTALSYTAPDNVRFQYRLEGLQDDWVDAGMNRVSTYNYLPPGDYEFHVRAANNDGQWNETGAAVAFELLPHFWQRGWFRGLAGLAVLGAVWLAYYFRMARLRELERLRLRIARDLHDDVGANLASMALIAEAMRRRPPFGDPEDLQRIALHTIDALRDIVWFIDPARDRLGDLVTRMRDTAPLLLTGLQHDFEACAPHPDLRLPPAFRRNVFPIFKEILHNAASHARARRVSIALDCRDGVLRLRVEDDGSGFDEASIIPGNGLRNLRRRAAEMRGTVRLRTAPGQGTVVEFAAPFPRTRGFPFNLRRLNSHGTISNQT